jgi:heme O synthase-like polyprenyltransferase
MTKASWNPKPNDYPGQFRFGSGALIAGLLLLIFGLNGSDNWFTALMLMVGISLIIGSGAIINTAWKSKERAKEAEND